MISSASVCDKLGIECYVTINQSSQSGNFKDMIIELYSHILKTFITGKHGIKFIKNTLNWHPLIKALLWAMTFGIDVLMFSAL